MKEVLYRQCELHRGKEIDISWIPSRFAQIGEYLKIKHNDKWTDGWKVIRVSSIEKDGKYLVERSQDYKNTRKASDI